MLAFSLIQVALGELVAGVVAVAVVLDVAIARVRTQ